MILGMLIATAEKYLKCTLFFLTSILSSSQDILHKVASHSFNPLSSPCLQSFAYAVLSAWSGVCASFYLATSTSSINLGLNVTSSEQPSLLPIILLLFPYCVLSWHAL